MKLMIIILCVVPGIVCRGQIRNSYSRNRRQSEGFISFPAVGSVDMTNARLNRWIETQGGSPSRNLIAFDLISMIEQKNGWDMGYTIGFLLPESGSLSSYYFDFLGGGSF